MKKFSLFVSILLFVTLFLCGCTASVAAGADVSEPYDSEDASSDSEDTSSADEIFFYATVKDTESDFGGILVDPEDDTLGGELVVHSDTLPTLQKGDRVKVIYDGQIALSYPGQIFGAKVIPVK